jgi:hypothetical protein
MRQTTIISQEITVNGKSKIVEIEYYEDNPHFGKLVNDAFLYKFKTGQKFHKNNSVVKYQNRKSGKLDIFEAALTSVFSNRTAYLSDWWNNDYEKSGWS